MYCTHTVGKKGYRFTETPQAFVEASTAGQAPGLHQTGLTEYGAISKSTTDKLTDTIVKWNVWTLVPFVLLRPSPRQLSTRSTSRRPDAE